MKPKAISDELARFHVDLNKELKGQKTARYIVATSSAFAVGLTLAEAISVGFQEPDYRAATMLQGYARHCRQGNKNMTVYSWMFLAERSAVEDKIVRVNKLRATINEAVERKTSEKPTEPVEVDDDDLYEA